MEQTDEAAPAATDRKARGLALLLEQSARLIYDQRHPNDLHAVQWSALRYFSRAGERARNVAGLSRYLGVTSAPASRTAASLLKRGLVSVSPSPDDSRSRVYDLTAAGTEMLKQDPINRVSDLLVGLSPEEQALLARVLDRICAALHN